MGKQLDFQEIERILSLVTNKVLITEDAEQSFSPLKCYNRGNQNSSNNEYRKNGPSK